MRVAVTGGTGLVGRFVIDRLLCDGYEVRAQARSSANIEGFAHSDAVSWCIGDMGDRDSINSLVEDCDAVVHAAFSHLPGRYRGGEGDDPISFWNSNFGGTLRCIEVARSAGARRVVLLSSRAVFDGLSVTTEQIEDYDEPCPTTHYGLVKYTCEQLASLYDDITVCSLRPTGIYGVTWPKEASKWWRLLVDHFGRRPNAPVGSSSKTEVHGEDVASAVSLLLGASEESVHGRCFNCSDIVVSEQRIVELAYSLFKDKSRPRPDQFPLLAHPRNTMKSRGLESLGWKPGGFDKLVETLSQIIELADLQFVERTLKR